MATFGNETQTQMNERLVATLGKLVKVIKNGIQQIGNINPKYTVNTFLIAFLGLVLFFLFNWFKNEQTVEIVNKAVERVLIQSQKADEKRDSIRAMVDGPQHYIHTMDVDHTINGELGELLNEVDADRVMLSSFHNHQEGVMLGYVYYDEAYEAVNKKRHITEVAQQYQNVRTSLTPFAGYMKKATYWQGTYKEVYDIDMRYSHHMEEDGAFFGAWYFIWSETGMPIGILSCSWHKDNRRYIPTAHDIEMAMKVYGEVIRNIIDKSANKNKSRV